MIVYATGFHANRYLWPMEIVGRDGDRAREQWGDEPTAYLGITVPNFPNLFCLYGPGTNLAHGGSLIFHSECQMRYVMGCLADGARPRVARPSSAGPRCTPGTTSGSRPSWTPMVWSHPSHQSSWYRNASGRIYILSPWRLVDYWAWTRARSGRLHGDLMRRARRLGPLVTSPVAG